MCGPPGLVRSVLAVMDMMTDNEMDPPDVHTNKVKAVDGEVRMENIRNRGVMKDPDE